MYCVLCVSELLLRMTVGLSGTDEFIQELIETRYNPIKEYFKVSDSLSLTYTHTIVLSKHVSVSVCVSFSLSLFRNIVTFS